jgi:hypothetical protein
MINEQMVIDVMRSALKSVSKKDKITLQELRIKMELNDSKDSVECSILKGKDFVSDLTWARILGVKVIFSNVITQTIKNMLIKLSQENQIEPNEINARIYAIDENATPNIYIYDGKKPLKKIDTSELI